MKHFTIGEMIYSSTAIKQGINNCGTNPEIEQNMIAWLQGRYVYEAIGAWAPIIRAFSKARKPGEYPDHPHDLFEEQRREREIDEQRERYERIKTKVEAFAVAFNEENAKKRAENATNGEETELSENESTPTGKEVDDNARCKYERD